MPADVEAQARALAALQRARAVSSALLRAQPAFLEGTAWMEPPGRGHHPDARQPILARAAAQGRSVAPVALPTPLGLAAVGTFAAHPTADPGSRCHPLSQMGPKGDTWRLHSCYDLLAGQLAWVQVSDRHLGAGFAHLPIQPADILVGDGASSRASQLVAVEQAKAFSLTRFSLRHLPVYASQTSAETSPAVGGTLNA